MDIAGALAALTRCAISERLLRDVWMFAQVLRAFLAKAEAAERRSDRWTDAPSFQFVDDFLVHFRALGYPLLRGQRYERLDAVLVALDQLREIDLVGPEGVRAAVDELHRLFEFLEGLAAEIGQRPELGGRGLDRRAAKDTLRIYLGR